MTIPDGFLMGLNPGMTETSADYLSLELRFEDAEQWQGTDLPVVLDLAAVEWGTPPVFCAGRNVRPRWRHSVRLDGNPWGSDLCNHIDRTGRMTAPSRRADLAAQRGA